MQDNSSRDELNLPIGKGWEQMKGQLDEVMPQRRRQLLWWWWLPLLLLVGGVGTYAWAELGGVFSEQPQREQEAVPQPPVAVTSESTGQAEKPETPNEKVVVLSADDTVSPREKKEPVPVVTGRKLEGQEAVLASASVVSKTNPVNGLNDSDQRAETANTHEQPINPSEVKGNSTVRESIEPLVAVEVSEEVTLKTRPQNSIISPIATLGIASLPVEAAPGLPSVRATTSPSLRWYAEGLGTTALNDPLVGLIAGIGMQRPLGQSWRLNAGLQYQERRNSFFSNELGNADLLRVEPTSEFSNSASYDIRQVYSGLRTQRLNTYVQADYRIHPRIRLGLGVQAGYYLQARALLGGGESAGLSSDPEGFPGVIDSNRGLELNLYDDQVSAVNFDERNNASTPPLDLKRWQWSAQSSISYHLHLAWSVEFQYVRSLTPWPAKGEVFGGPDNLQLGLRYYFRR